MHSALTIARLRKVKHCLCLQITKDNARSNRWLSISKERKIHDPFIEKLPLKIAKQATPRFFMGYMMGTKRLKNMSKMRSKARKKTCKAKSNELFAFIKLFLGESCDFLIIFKLFFEFALADFAQPAESVARQVSFV